MRTVNDMFDRHEREVLPRLAPTTRLDYSYHITGLRKLFGAKGIKALTRSEIVEFMDVPTAKIGRNRRLAVLSAAYTEAIRWGWADANPCSLIERHESKPDSRKLKEEDFEAVRAVLSKTKGGWRIVLVMDLARHTGQLQSAIIGLRWSQIHEQVGTILFRHNITHKKIVVSITPEIRSILAQAKQRTGDGEYVVTSGKRGTKYTDNGFRAGWQKFMRTWVTTGNDRFTFHDIRRLAKTSEEITHNNVGEEGAVHPQFEAGVWAEATAMSRHYAVFYCLEQSIRQLIISTMSKNYGVDWWSQGKVNPEIQQEVMKLMSKEIDSGMTQRSEREIDYTTFGQLSQIIVQNWEVFNKVLKSNKAVGNVMASLNRIRGPIAHCSPMSEREVTRLSLTVEDWFNILL